MLDPSDYQNTNGVNSGVINYMNGMGSQGVGAAGGSGSWLKQAGNWLGSDSIAGGGMSNGNFIFAADQMGGQLFGMLAGQNETKVGNIMKKIPGLSTVGNLINAAFGSHINDEFVAQTRYGTNAINSQTFRSNTNADVLNDWKNSFQMAHVHKDDVGSDGWFSSDAEDTTNDLNNAIDKANMRQLMNLGIAAGNADQNTDLRILQGMQAAYGGPINSFRKYYSKGGYLNQAKALIRQNEGWREKPYADAPKGKNWRSVGYGFNDSGFREKYPEGISKHYEHGITKKQAEEELDYFLSKAEKQLKSIYGKQWNDFTDSQKAAILDTYYQRPASVGKGSRFYKAVTAGEDAGKYLGVAGFDKRNKIRRGVFGGSQDYVNLGAETENPSANSSSLQEVTPFTPVVHDLDLSGITPTQAKALELDLTSPVFDLSMFGSMPTQQESYIPTVGTVEDFLASYGDFDDMLFAQGGFLGRRYEGEGNLPNYLERPKSYTEQFSFSNEPIYGVSIEYPELGLTEDDLRYLTELSYNQGMDKLKTIGFDEKGNIKKSEIEAIREMAKPDAKVKDISSTNYRHLGAVGRFLYDKFGSAHTPYISAAEKYRSQLLSRLQANPEGAVAQAKAFGGNLFDNGGWMDFFQAWNQAKGGNNYFSQGNGNWKPSDGLQKNTSNGSAQDWLGVAGTVVNTIGNWGKEDPSLGRGGGYSQFGMAAFDIAKTIRDATKSKRESIDQKLGIPIYARGGRLFADGGSTGGGEGVGAMGYAQIGTAALKLASNAVHQASLDEGIDEDKIHRSIDRYGMGLDEAVANVNTNGDLLDLWENNSSITPNLSMRDFRNKSYFDDFLDSYAASWEGFNAGQNFGPWGAAIGAVVGGVSSVVGSIIGRNKADNAADEANARIERANERRSHNLIAAAERVDEENDLRILQNMGANGGKLNMGFGLRNPFVMPDGTANPLYKAFGGGLTHGMDWNTGINWVDEGGSHGENPLGGVPMGVDEQGIPNLVEEGEAIWNGDYVFSKRMKVPKKLREKYSLPDDATFADAVAKLTKSSDERPLSPIDRNTQDYILGEFADTQEEMRMAKAQRAMDKQQQLQDDFLMGMQFGLGGHMSSVGIIPDSDNVSLFDKLENSFADGGGIHIDPSKKGTFKAQASKMGMGVQEAASHILAHKENYSPAMVKKANFAKNFAHAFGGSLFDNPFGEVNTFDFGGDLKTRRDSIIRNSGVTEEQANAMLFRMLSKEDRGRAIKERVFGTWTPTYNSNNEIVVPAATTSNRGNVNGGTSRSTGNSKTASQKSGTKSKAASSVTTKPKGVTGLNLYDWYRNGSDGISEPTGFKVGQNGKAYDYTQEYKDLVNSLGADDIRKWAAEHPDDPSLKSFLAKGNDLSKLTDDQWRTGATDGKYGFMHHVADSLLGGNDEFEEMTEPAVTRAAEDPEWAVDFGDHEVMRNIEAGLNPDGTTPASNTGTTRSGFKPKQTWTRNLPWMMSGIMGLKEMLTPADYGNADMILDAAYRAGQPISVGTEYIGDYRKRNPFDERYLMNIINQRGAAANRNFMNLSGGNRAVAMSGILANDLTTQMSLAEAARQAYLANREDDAKVAEFNRGTNIFNAQAQNTRNLSLAQLNSQRQNAMLSGIAQGARLRQAIKDQRDAAISANLSAFAQGLGDLGKENGYYNMLGGLNDEGVLDYFYGNNWRTMFNNNKESV